MLHIQLLSLMLHPLSRVVLDKLTTVERCEGLGACRIGMVLGGRATDACDVSPFNEDVHDAWLGGRCREKDGDNDCRKRFVEIAAFLRSGVTLSWRKGKGGIRNFKVTVRHAATHAIGSPFSPPVWFVVFGGDARSKVASLFPARGRRKHAIT